MDIPTPEEVMESKQPNKGIVDDLIRQLASAVLEYDKWTKPIVYFYLQQDYDSATINAAVGSLIASGWKSSKYEQPGIQSKAAIKIAK